MLCANCEKFQPPEKMCEASYGLLMAGLQKRLSVGTCPNFDKAQENDSVYEPTELAAQIDQCELIQPFIATVFA